MINTDQIKEHMEVKSADGMHVGIVDHLEGSDRIKLTKSDSPDGAHHHMIPVEWVDHIDAHVHLSKNEQDVRSQWTHLPN